jgi:hypothetical protein
MDEHSKVQGVMEQSKARWGRPTGPVIVGVFFAALAIVLTVVGLWREDNLSLRNVVLGVVLSGGTWGLVSWAIAAAVVQVEEDVASRKGEDGGSAG